MFGLTHVTVVSQRFHTERAVYIARAHGLDAFGFAAADVGGAAGFLARIRELASRVVAVLDVRVLGTRPRFLGPKVSISGAR